MNKLPLDITNIIWENLYNNEVDVQNIRLICKNSENQFQKFIIPKTRNICRESLCSNLLKNNCFLGRYCSCNCYFFHITS